MIRYDLFGQNIFNCHKNDFEGVFMQKNTKNYKKCQLYDVIMTSRQYLMKF